MKKSIKKNYMYNLLYQVLIMILPLILTPYLSRTLGAEKIGIYSYTFSILSYFVLFGCVGIGLYGQREIARVQDDKEKRSKIFFELAILKFIMIFTSFIVYGIFYFNDETYSIYYKILTIELFSNAIDITWFYQGIEDFKKITIRNTIVRITSVALIFIFVKDQSDLITYFLINGIANFISFLALWLNLKKFVCKVKIKELNIFHHIKQTILLFIPQVAIQIYTVLDKTMIGSILNDMTEVGYYEQSQKIVKMLLMLIAALGTVMIPRISNLYANNKEEELKSKIYKVFNIVSFIAFPMCFGLIGVSENFVPWFYGEEFLPITNLLCIFSFLLIAIGFSNITGMQYLIPTQKQSIFTFSVTLGALLNVLLNLLLIPRLKGYGAAIASVIVEIIVFIVQAICIRKTFDFKKIFLENIKYLIISIIMFLGVSFIGKYLNASIYSTVIQIGIGGIIYISILLIMRDKILFEILNIAKNTLKRGDI